jgi:hypothetical protein
VGCAFDAVINGSSIIMFLSFKKLNERRLNRLNYKNNFIAGTKIKSKLV